MEMIGEVRGEESALPVCRIPDGRPERNGILLELGSDATLSDLEVVASMIACAASFRHFARGEPNRDPRSCPVLSSSREKSSLKDKGVTASPFVGKY